MYANLKWQIWRNGIRQHQLAKAVGVDPTLLSKIINGLREPTPEVRKKIATLLNRDEDWLFEPVENIAPPLFNEANRI